MNCDVDARGSELASAKRRVGRPTKYRHTFCARVEQLGAEGKSMAQIAAALGVDRASLYRWTERHEDFAQCLARARTFAQAWWEGLGMKNLGSKDFQPQVWKMIMAARFKDDYSKHKIGSVPSDVVDELCLRDALSRTIG